LGRLRRDQKNRPDTMPLRSAQPPGGRTSFAFNDGSDNRLARQMPAPQAPPPPRGGFAQAPGGYSSWDFDDRGGDGDRDGERRHTNGVLRSKDPNRVPAGGRSSIDLSDASSAGGHGYVPPVPARYGQPAGGRSSIDLSQDASGSGRAGGHGGDSLDAFVQRAPPAVAPPPFATAADSGSIEHRRALAPPGGRSSFSLGWGEDSHVNHHMHYHRREPERGHILQPPMRDGAASGHAMARDPTNSAFSKAFAADNHIKSIPRAPAQDGYGDRGPVRDFTGLGGGFGGGGGGGGESGWARPSVHVAAPPGGASSIVFG